MKQRNNRPRGAITIRTYAELEQFVGAFGRGLLNLLIIIGAAGLQKSRVVRAAVGAEATYVEGNATAFQIYRDLYDGRDRLVVLDDVDGLYADRQAVRLLKNLAQTEAVKSVAWNSASRQLEGDGIPRRFDTRSRVLIVGNDWKSLNGNVAAVVDRGHLGFFEPSPAEVHRRVASWFRDQEVFDFLADHMHLVEAPSMRQYVGASELKAAGMDWRGVTLQGMLSGPALRVASLKADLSFASEEDRGKAFTAAGWGCRATYFNHARKLSPPGEVERIILPTCQVDASGSDPSLLEVLRRRPGRLGDG
jgi:hypothetical protein